jgi:hypothetical protein
VAFDWFVMRSDQPCNRFERGKSLLKENLLCHKVSRQLDISELKQVTFLTTRTSTGSKVDVFHQSQPLTQSSDVTHAVRVVKNVTCLSLLLSHNTSFVPRLQVRRAGLFPFLTKRRSKSKRLGTRLSQYEVSFETAGVVVSP